MQVSVDSPPAQTVAQLIAQAKRNPIRWLIPDILLEGGTHILHGKEESFKTMLTLQMHEALARGGEFLTRPVQGGLRTGIVELEEKPRLFGERLRRFFPHGAPPIQVLPDDRRSDVLASKTPEDRIYPIVEWAKDEGLDLVSIDSAVKLFPPHYDLSKPDQASEVFNQLQELPTLWLIAHDRKRREVNQKQVGNEEIVGSGRFAQDPDVIHQLERPDARAPRAIFHWGKVREGEKAAPLDLWFDRVDFRLYPIHPFVYLLNGTPRLEEELILEAQKRYGWHERRAREYIGKLYELKDSKGSPVVSESHLGHKKVLALVGQPVLQDAEEGGSLQV
jgi:hypothetical protein